MSGAHIHLLLDATRGSIELMAECPSCGAITTDELSSAWTKGSIVCECGLVVEVESEHLRHLRAMATEVQYHIDDLIGRN